MKRKVLSLVTGVCILFGIMFAGCSSGSSDDDDVIPVKLEERLKSAKNDDTIDIIEENIVITENTSYTIEKPLTVKNGAMKNASFTVKSEGVILDSLTDVSKITVDESVGDGDFTVDNCGTVNDVYVNGGGSNSIHIAGTRIKKVSVHKNKVRITLEVSRGKISKIEKTFIFSDCKLEANNTSSGNTESSSDSTENELSFGNVVITETVEKVELAGSAVVDNLISMASSDTELKIAVDADVKIAAADSTVKEIIENDEGNSEFNEKAEVIKDAELSDEEKQEIQSDISDIQEENNSDTSDTDEDTDSGELLTFYALAKFGNSYNSTNPDWKKNKVDSIDGITIEKDDSEVIVLNSNSSQELDKMWEYIIQSEYGSVKLEQGKNYKVSIDLKADKETYIVFKVKDNYTMMNNNRDYEKVSTEYQTYSIFTGTAGHQWTKGTVEIAIGNVSKLYIKNYRIEEISEQQVFGFEPYYSEEDLIGKINTTAGDGYAEIAFKIGDLDNTGLLGVDVVLFNHPLDVGELYKINVDITSDTALDSGDIGIYMHSYSDDVEVAGSGNLSFDANTKKTVTFYTPVYAGENETFRIPYIYFTAKKQCSLKVENIAAEKTTFETIKTKNSALGLYFGGSVNGNWGYYPENSVVDIEPNAEVCGQILLCDENGWDSKENTVTSFRVIGETETGLDSEVKTDGDIQITNNTNETVSMCFGIDETDGYKVVLTAAPSEN